MSISEIDNNSEINIKQSDRILTRLKHHQLLILNNAIILENNKINNTEFSINTKIGILCDNVGSGKSLSILSIIANKIKLVIDSPTVKNYDNLISICKINHFNYVEANIIVVPFSLIKQWSNYIQQDTKLNYIVINNKKTFENFKENYDILINSDILLISNTKYNDFASYIIDKLQNIKFSRIIYDEADSINIPACVRLDASFYWMITSNYFNLLNPDGVTKWHNFQNNTISNYYSYSSGHINRIRTNGIKCTGFIKNTLKSIMYLTNDYLKYIYLRNNTKYVQSSFNLINPIFNKQLCENSKILHILQDNINNNILSHLNAGDIEGAIQALNCTKIDKSNIIYAVTKELEINYNNKKIELEMKSQMHYANETQKQAALEKLHGDMQKIQNKIENIKSKIKDAKLCPICYDNIENQMISKCCNTTYCFACLSMWLSEHKTCPHCRTNITNDDIVLVIDKVLDPPKKIKDKLYYFEKIINEINQPDSKILIFSEFDNIFSHIDSILNKYNIKHKNIFGNGTNNTINNYKLNNEDDNSIKALLLNSRNFGTGLNLENTTHMIIYHKMDKELIQQIVGRAQRPNRRNQLKIYALCYQNEMDLEI